MIRFFRSMCHGIKKRSTITLLVGNYFMAHFSVFNFFDFFLLTSTTRALNSCKCEMRKMKFEKAWPKLCHLLGIFSLLRYDMVFRMEVIRYYYRILGWVNLRWGRESNMPKCSIVSETIYRNSSVFSKFPHNLAPFPNFLQNSDTFSFNFPEISFVANF